MNRCFIILLPGIQVLVSCTRSSKPDSDTCNNIKDTLLLVNSFPNLYIWTYANNVYVLRDGDKALLIDLGNGRVLSHWPYIGLKQLERLVFTHHHHEQYQGYPLLEGLSARIAVSGAEKAFLNGKRFGEWFDTIIELIN